MSINSIPILSSLGSESSSNEEEGDQSVAGTSNRFRLGEENVKTLKEILSTADRFGLSDTATAHMMNASMVTGDSSNVMYQKKVNNWRKKFRLEKVKESKGKAPLALGIDERRDSTRVQVGEGEKGHKRTEIQKVENFSVVSWPGAEYMGHFQATTGTGSGLAKDLMQFLKERDTDLTKLKAILSDGTNKMTGWKGGALACFEELVNSPLQRLICFLHHGEKPFEKIFVHHDGPTTGPESFEGPIGKEITDDVWKKPVMEFEQLDNPALLDAIESLPDETFQTFNKDHQYLIKMVHAVLTGNISEQWANMKTGKIVQSRFTNTQASILRLYISKENPSYELKRLVSFIIFVYAPVFLAAKHFNRAEEGPKLLLSEIRAVRIHCTEEEAEVLQASVQQNGFYAHHENVLLTLLSSDEVNDRQFAVNTIKTIRSKLSKKRGKGKKSIRVFKVPKINFNATSLYDLTEDPLSSATTEPPVTIDMSDTELESLVKSPLDLGLPLSTVAVERAVKTTTSASRVTSNSNLQDGFSMMGMTAVEKNPISLRNKKIWHK